MEWRRGGEGRGREWGREGGDERNREMRGGEGEGGWRGGADESRERMT